MNNKLYIPILIIIFLIISISTWLWLSARREVVLVKPLINSFEECLAAGHPVMESYPRQCRDWEQTFVEVIQDDQTDLVPQSGEQLNEAEARAIAESACVKGGEALDAGYYNATTRTWWFDANLNVVKPGCNPACVVSEETGLAELNWRCSGLDSSVLPADEKSVAEQLAECLPLSDMASHEKCQKLIQGIGNYEECAAAGFVVHDLLPPTCFTPDGRSFTRQSNGTWETAQKVVEDCLVQKAFQTHDRMVTLELMDGEELIVAEPRIDEIMKIIDESKVKCGPVMMATE